MPDSERCVDDCKPQLLFPNDSDCDVPLGLGVKEGGWGDLGSLPLRQCLQSTTVPRLDNGSC